MSKKAPTDISVFFTSPPSIPLTTKTTTVISNIAKIDSIVNSMEDASITLIDMLIDYKNKK